MVSPSVLVVIQARLRSARLPNKALKLISEKPMIQHVYERARAIRGVDDVVVAVPDVATKQAFEVIGIPALHYPNITESDVLGRYAAVARQFESHHVFVRVTGDCPLLAPDVVEAVILDLDESLASFSSNVANGYHDGTDAEAFTRELLLKADANISNPFDREHVTSGMHQAPKEVIAHKLKLSVDTLDDLVRVEAIYAHLAPGDYSLAATLKAAKLARV